MEGFILGKTANVAAFKRTNKRICSRLPRPGIVMSSKMSSRLKKCVTRLLLMLPAANVRIN